MEKIILYYKFVPVSDPEMTRLWQFELCTRLGLRGRVIISRHGINGTLGGPLESLRAYKSSMNKTDVFKGIMYKWSEGGAKDFPKLSVKVRDELVAFHAADELVVDAGGVVNGGKHLKPEQVHQLVKERGMDVVFFDGRNAYEASVGRFKMAVIPDVSRTRDYKKELDDPKYDRLKDKPIVTYCTGGVRCEVLSAMMKNRGFKEVYQIEGGIVKYGQKYGDDGLWEGNLYVFDDRMNVKFSDKAADIGECIHCGKHSSNFENCANISCNNLILLCRDCKTKTTTCSGACQKALAKAA